MDESFGSHGWERGDALLLLAIRSAGVSLGDLLYWLLATREFATPTFDELRCGLDRLLRAELITLRADGKLAPTPNGSAVLGDAEGRYLSDSLPEAFRRLVEVGIPAEAARWQLARTDYDAGIDAAFALQKQWISREGLSGRAKWREWNSPWLDLDECLEFLTFIEGRDVVVEVERKAESESEEAVGELGPMRRKSTGSDSLVVFDLHDDGKRSGSLQFGEAGFRTAAFKSLDGVDYFVLQMTFDDRTILIRDPVLGGHA